MKTRAHTYTRSLSSNVLRK